MFKKEFASCYRWSTSKNPLVCEKAGGGVRGKYLNEQAYLSVADKKKF